MNHTNFIHLSPTLLAALPQQLPIADPGATIQGLPLSFAILMLLLGALAAAAGYWAYREYFAKPSPHKPEDPFSEQSITQTFISALPSLTRELNLEVATSKQTELLERSNSKYLLGLNLGTNAAQIRMPVTYRYHVRLHDSWQLNIRDKSIVVHAPLIRPSQPPAIHTDEMHIESKRGWGRLMPYDLVSQLHKDVTPILSQYAEDPRRLQFVREIARQSVADFVRLWLERESRWNRSRFTSIQVQFRDEKVLPYGPTLQLTDARNN